jgi:hypothetical protein
MDATNNTSQEDKIYRGKSIATAICKEFGYDITEIICKDNRREKSDLRHVICKVLTGMSLSHRQVGSIINRKRITVTKSLQEFESLIQTNDAFGKRYERSLRAAQQCSAFMPTVFFAIMKYDRFDRQYLPIKDGFASHGAAFTYLVEKYGDNPDPSARGQYFIDKYLQI